MSVSTAGAVDFRSDKERIARSAKLTQKEAKKQTQIMQESAQVQQQLLTAMAAGQVTSGPPAGWYTDERGTRWEWNGHGWTGRTA